MPVHGLEAKRLIREGVAEAFECALNRHSAGLLRRAGALATVALLQAYLRQGRLQPVDLNYVAEAFSLGGEL
jgi:hypothetical protein